MTRSRESESSRAGARNQALWLLVPIWAVAVAGSLYATLQSGISVLTVADIGWAILQGAMIVTGVIILANRPGNAVGRLILAAGVSFAAGWLLFIPSVLFLESGDLYLAGLAEAISNAAATLWLPLLAAAFIYFPGWDASVAPLALGSPLPVGDRRLGRVRPIGQRWLGWRRDNRDHRESIAGALVSIG